MSRRIDKKTAHRRAAAPSIDFSMLPMSPEGLALREELEQLRAEERARAEARAAQAAADATADPSPAGTPTGDAAARSPYRGRDTDGRTLQPLDAPTAARLEAEAFGQPSAAPVQTGVDPNAPTVPPLRQSQIPTLHLPGRDAPPPADLAPEPALAPTRRPAAGRSAGPTIMPSDAELSERGEPELRAPRDGSAEPRASRDGSAEAGPALPPVAPPPPPLVPRSAGATVSPRDGSAEPRAPRDRSAEHSAPHDGSAEHLAPRDGSAEHLAPRDGSAEHLAPRDGSAHRPARAIHEPAVTAGDPDSDDGAYAPPPLHVTSAPPRVDRHDTLVSQPPDAAFFADSAPIDEQEIAEDIEGWERRRWLRRLGAFLIVAVIVIALLVVAIAGAYTLYAETSAPLLPGG